MNRNMVQLVRYATLLCALWFSAAVSASIDVLDYVNVENGAEQSTIHIHLNIPVRYKSHVPDNSGDVLRIFVEPLPLPGAEGNILLGRESIQWSPDSRVPLFDVIYEGEGFANTTITLSFQKNVAFEVQPAPDPRSLIVSIRHPAAPARPDDVSVMPGSVPLAPDSETSGIAAAPEQVVALMQDARRSMEDKDYDAAIRLYTKILGFPENSDTRPALEFLGLARERKGQLAHAKAVYEEYLSRYSEGEGADRVRQRLAGLLTARKQPKGKLRSAKTEQQDQASWDVFGGFSQFYRRDENTQQLDEDDELTTVSQSSLSTDMDITGRLSNNDYDVRSRFTGGYLYDFLEDGEDSESTVSSFYLNAEDRQRGYSMRLGRQSRSSGGVLGRFDGLLLGVPLGSVFSLNPVAGFPVESSSDNVDTDKYFYGLTLGFDGFAKGWDGNTFIIEQRVDGEIDRRAVGGELRYFDLRRSFFSLVDYDIHHSKLNIWQFLGNWTFANKATLNLVLDYRNSPILTTSNALIGQTTDSIDEMKDSYSVSEIEDIASDRTARARLATIGISSPLTERFQISSDLTVTDLSDSGSSAGVEGIVGTGADYFYSLQLVGSNLIKPGDIAIFEARYADADTTDTISLSVNTRYPVTSDFRINPRFRVDFRNNSNDDSDQVIYRPSLRLNYQLKRRLRFEAELGGEWSEREITDGSDKSRSYFITIGYRADF